MVYGMLKFDRLYIQLIISKIVTLKFNITMKIYIKTKLGICIHDVILGGDFTLYQGSII